LKRIVGPRHLCGCKFGQEVTIIGAVKHGGESLVAFACCSVDLSLLTVLFVCGQMKSRNTIRSLISIAEA
jgi:hypothetical protein